MFDMRATPLDLEVDMAVDAVGVDEGTTAVVVTFPGKVSYGGLTPVKSVEDEDSIAGCPVPSGLFMANMSEFSEFGLLLSMSSEPFVGKEPKIGGLGEEDMTGMTGSAALGWTQWYWTSRYFDVPGQGSPKILVETTTEQLDAWLHLSCIIKKDRKDMQLTDKSSWPVGLQMDRENLP